MPRVIFITGCSSGIGRASALLFARHKYKVIATARNLNDLQELQQISEQEQLNLKITACDVTDENSVLQALEFAKQSFGSIEILLNNAGYALISPVESVSIEEAQKQFDVNTFAPLRLIQLVAPQMREKGWGRIINVSSIGGRALIPLAGWYSSSKFALEALNDALRFELEPFGIKTISILPGRVETEFRAKVIAPDLPKNSPPLYQKFLEHLAQRQKNLKGTGLSAEKVAEVILQAAESSNPKPRYYVTREAKLVAFAKRFISDRRWDKLTKSSYGFDKM